jgi:hypothetical protein
LAASDGKTGIEIINQNETVSRLYRLISEAERYLYLVSPYVSLDKLRSLVRHVQGALSRGVKVKLVVRQKDFSTGNNDVLASESLPALRDAGLEVFVVKDLHAKIYLSEKNALMTSLNLLETSFNNSIEVGTWLRAGTPEYEMLVRFLGQEIKPSLEKVIEQPAVGRPASAAAKKPPSRARTQEQGNSDGDGGLLKKVGAVLRAAVEFLPSRGFCIRCGESVDYEPGRPLCREDYLVWKRYEDPTYRESYCHSCGEPSGTSVAKPLCLDCFRDR